MSCHVTAIHPSIHPSTEMDQENAMMYLLRGGRSDRFISESVLRFAFDENRSFPPSTAAELSFLGLVIVALVVVVVEFLLSLNKCIDAFT